MIRTFREKKVIKTRFHCLWHLPEDTSNGNIFMQLPELLESICFSPKSTAAVFALNPELHQSPSAVGDMGCSFQSSCGPLKAFKSWFLYVLKFCFFKKHLHRNYLSSRSTYNISISLEIIVSLLYLDLAYIYVSIHISHVFSASISLLRTEPLQGHSREKMNETIPL